MAGRAPLRWTVVFGWRLRWNWSWFRDKLVKASTRPHTTSTYQGDLHAMPAKSLAFHKQRGRVGGQVPSCYLCAYIKKNIYIYTTRNANPNHPLTKQTHLPRSFLWDTKSRNSLPSFSAHTLFCLPSPGFQGWRLMSRALGRDETRKADMLTPRVRVQWALDSRCGTGRRDLLLALQQRHRRVCAPQ